MLVVSYTHLVSVVLKAHSLAYTPSSIFEVVELVEEMRVFGSQEVI